ncbi:LOW QUALITY PROTEIN: uncharacterized protein LOC105930835 [Fundulus heteroclitus]|uniref:LOW QUALITY PROTEIN: uncharacterized protein LOC105930835 n=1 Tax=Fundulus heteroclitus TaxID=8078 RepID=UPI00165AF54B|nr:LOW QUALITY PROTEIN: uncharacterized protein LOC105930835 [Fundulus heteroclitus]
MSCVEKRHINHRMGSMLHHRFPNGFTDLFMDETDREVSTLTDRAFRSLCIGDDAVYNDDFLYGYSPYSCLKPLAGDPFKKNPQKDSKKAEQHKPNKSNAQPWKQQHQDNISHMSSFLKVLSAAEERNGGMTDSNGESWDKSALRSIERELSEFSSGLSPSLTNRHYNKDPHPQSGGGSNKKCKDASLPSGKLTKTKNGKSTVKLRKLNIKNFFLHSEFSPFQTWTDLNRYPFGQDNTVTDILSPDNVPKWYDFPFYKELTEAHTTESLHADQVQSCDKVEVESSAAKVPEPTPAPPPPKVLPKPAASLTGKRCSSDGGEKNAAPWRRNGPRAKSAIPANQLGKPPQESHLKPMDENILVVKKDVETVEVTAIQEVSSLASTPFSICQLMTPVIPSRQPTETSEIFQAVLSPSVLDLLSRPHSEAKVTPEPPVKRETYKSLASSILFNLKDNRKRVKSRYSPHKFKTLELCEGALQSPPSDNHPPSEGSGSGLSTPAISKDGLTVSGPVLEHIVSPSDFELTTYAADKPVSDYLLTNLLQTRCDAGSIDLGEENSTSPFIPSKKNKSPMAKKQNYPSLNLYKKANQADSDPKYLQVPQSNNISANTDLTIDAKNRELPPNALPTNTGLSPSTLNVIKDYSPMISPHTLEKGGILSGGRTQPNVPEKTGRSVKGTKEFAAQLAHQEDNTGGQTISATNVIRAAKEAINAAKNKARSASHSECNSKLMPDADLMRQKEMDQRVSKEPFESRGDSLVTVHNCGLLRNEPSSAALVGENSNVNKEPPPVPKKNFAKSDLKLCLSLDKQERHYSDKPSNGDLIDVKPDVPTKDSEPVQKQGKPKNVFSSRQNNFIKHQRYALPGDEQAKEYKESNLNVNAKMETDVEMKSIGDIGDSEHIFNDLQALKELERARLGDRMLENVKSKLEVFNIDEEAKAKNCLISRELRNIKRGMLSMRGNTLAKRKIFAEKEQSKQEIFAKLDSNVIVNKALLNDNYDKAKMALEEIISERERRRYKFTEQDTVLSSEDNVLDESCETWPQDRKKHDKDCLIKQREEKDDNTSPLKENNLNQRLGDLRVSETRHRPVETQRMGSRVALPAMDTVDRELSLVLNTKDVREKLANNHTHIREDSLPETARKVCKDSEEYLTKGREDKRLDAPPVPPRSKKGVSRQDESAPNDKEPAGDIIYGKSETFENNTDQLCNIRTGSEIYTSADTEEALPSQHGTSYKERQDEVDNGSLKLRSAADTLTLNNLILNTSPKATAEETCKVKQKAPLKPDSLIKHDDDMIKNVTPEEEPSRMTNKNLNMDAEELDEISRNIVSPLLLVKGANIAQSPPDQASLSSKSSYFSVESTLHRTTENESNVFHSLGNSPAEVDLVNEPGQTISQSNSNTAGAEYSCLSDHESEREGIKQLVKSTQNQPDQYVDSNEKTNVHTEAVSNEENNSTTSSSSTFSPTLGIPALFKVKDNSFNSKTKKPVLPWSPRGSLNGSEKTNQTDKMLHQTKENPEPSQVNDTSTNNSTISPTEVFKGKEVSTCESPLFLALSSNVLTENFKTSQTENSLVVPLEDERFSRVTPSSEGMESVPASTADPTEDSMAEDKVLAESEETKDISEQSGFISSGNDSQTGLPKPPAVLPKSEKAVQKAIKLTNRRMKKEETQKSSQKSSQSNSKHRTEKTRNDKAEHKSNGSAKTSRSGEKKHKDGNRHHSNDSNAQGECHNKNNKQNKVETNHRTRRPTRDSEEGNNQSADGRPNLASERQGRSTDRHAREKPEHRDYSNDSVISHVPVYKAHVSERPMSDRPFNRSQSIDRYLGGKAERRLSADLPVSDKLEPRTQRIEESIMHELQQRGRAKDKPSGGHPLRRSQSIDTYRTEIPPLSRQSSHPSQFSRQSSMEHAVFTQSIPMTQRKLLQDPDSGQYFFVDLPVQVKTKTFFDPGTGSYVQLPVQSPDGGVPQAPHVEVLTSPLVVYHSFVPVPLSPMAQKAPIQASHVKPNMVKQRHQETARQMHIKEGQPYLEPAYGQHELMLGEFLGTEELDCPC